MQVRVWLPWYNDLQSIIASISNVVTYRALYCRDMRKWGIRYTNFCNVPHWRWKFTCITMGKAEEWWITIGQGPTLNIEICHNQLNTSKERNTHTIRTLFNSKGIIKIKVKQPMIKQTSILPQQPTTPYSTNTFKLKGDCAQRKLRSSEKDLNASLAS